MVPFWRLIIFAALIIIPRSGDNTKSPNPNVPSVIPATFGLTSDRDLFKDKELDDGSILNDNDGTQFQQQAPTSGISPTGRRKGRRQGNSNIRDKKVNLNYYEPAADNQGQQATHGHTIYSKYTDNQSGYRPYDKQSFNEDINKQKITDDYLAKLQKFHDIPGKNYDSSTEGRNVYDKDKQSDYQRFLRYAYKHYGNQFPDYFQYLQESKGILPGASNVFEESQQEKSSIQDILRSTKPQRYPESLYEHYAKLAANLNSGKIDPLSGIYGKFKPLDLFDNPLDQEIFQNPQSTEDGFSPSLGKIASGGRKRKRLPIRPYENQEYFVNDSIQVGPPKSRPQKAICSGSRCRKHVRPELGRNGISERARRPRRPRF